MTKDEMKNRISMALKDPVLQQGFEINNWCKGDDPCPHLKKRDEQLTKAKKIIRNCLNLRNSVMTEETEIALIKEAEQFLKE